MYRVEVTPVLGLPQFTGWSQVVTNQVDEAAGVNKHFVCALAVSGEHAGNAGRTLADFLQESQPSSAADFHQLLQELQTQAKELEVELSFAAGLFSQEKMTLAVLAGSILLKRDNKLGLVLRSSREIKLLAGRHQSSDILVLVTEQAADFLNEIELKFRRGFGLDSVVTSIVPGLHDLQDSSLSSLAFISGGETVQAVKAVKTVKAVKAKEESAPEPEIESFTSANALDEIPPALKLRGAGKNRQKTVELKEKLNQPQVKLNELGQTPPSAKGPRKRFSLKKTSSAISKVIINFWQWLQSINWVGFWSQLKKFWQNILKFFERIKTGAKSFWRRLTAQDIYLPSRSGKKRLKLIWLFVFLLILVLSGLGYRSFRRSQQESLANEALQPYREKLTTARDLVATNPVVARREVREVMLALEELGLSYEDQPLVQELVVAELNQARALAEEISGLEQLDQLEIFFDLRNIDENFVASQVDAVDQQAVFLDEGRQSILSLDLSTADARLFSFESNSAWRDLTLDQESLKLLGTGISEIFLATDLATSNERGLSPELIINEGDSNRAGQLLETYAGYIYVLNAERREIYRYAQQEAGYSDPIGWVSGAVTFDYQEVSSWAIDGEIWVATHQGGLHRLAAGAEQEFSVVGLEQPFTDSLKLFTNENLDELYVLEPNQERLVVLNKEGQFLRELRSASLATTTDLFVSETGQVFTVSGSIIYALDF